MRLEQFFKKNQTFSGVKKPSPFCILLRFADDFSLSRISLLLLTFPDYVCGVPFILEGNPLCKQMLFSRNVHDEEMLYSLLTALLSQYIKILDHSLTKPMERLVRQFVNIDPEGFESFLEILHQLRSSKWGDKRR